MLFTEVNQYFAFGLSGVTSWPKTIFSNFKKQIYDFLSVNEAYRVCCTSEWTPETVRSNLFPYFEVNYSHTQKMWLQ